MGHPTAPLLATLLLVALLVVCLRVRSLVTTASLRTGRTWRSSASA